MKEPFDEYADQFTIVGNPYGVAMSFLRSAGLPAALGTVVPAQTIGTIRMSRELTKSIMLVLTNWVQAVEKQVGTIQVPSKSGNEPPTTLEDLWNKPTQ